MYEANGAHPIPGRDRVSFAGLARAAGYPIVHEIAELGIFEAALPQLLTVPGPVFADLKLVPGEPPPQDYAFIHGPEARQVFRAALKR
jgi:phosphonopyruvate decarboxylase